MKTSERVQRLALYASTCCNEEALLDTTDYFTRCPKCERLCWWELVEEVLSWQELAQIEQAA